MLFKVIYNSYTIGGDSTVNRQVDALSFSEAGGGGSFVVDFFLFGATVAAYNTAKDTMVAALAEPEAAFTITHGATTVLAGDPASRSAFDIESAIERVPDPMESDRVKRWRLTVTFRRPLRKAGDANRISSSVAVSFNTSRLRLVSITVSYSASAAAGAYAVATGAFPSFAASILSGLSGTFDTVSEGPYDRDHRDSLCTVTGVYRERNDSLGVSDVLLDDFAFSRVLNVDPAPSKRVLISATVAAHIDAEDVAADALPAKIAAIRTAVLTKALAYYSASSGYIESGGEKVDASGSTVSGEYAILLVPNDYTFLRTAAINRSFTASRRETVFIYGMYQAKPAVGANPAVGARENYEDDVDAFCESVLDGFLGEENYELLYEAPTETDDEDMHCSFARSYQQILWTALKTAIPTAVAEEITFTAATNHDRGPEGEDSDISGNISASFALNEGDMNSSLLHDIAELARDTVMAQASTMLGTEVVLSRETHALDPAGRRITFSYDVMGVASDVLSARRVVTHSVNRGLIVYNKMDGVEFSADIGKGISTHLVGVQDTLVSFSPPQNLLGSSRGVATPLDLGMITSSAGNLKLHELGAPSVQTTERLVGGSSTGTRRMYLTSVSREYILLRGKKLDPVPEAPESFARASDLTPERVD